MYFPSCRYVTSFGKRCTHLVVHPDADEHSSAKIQLAVHNQDRWGTCIITPAWVLASTSCNKRLPEMDFAMAFGEGQRGTAEQQQMLRFPLAQVQHAGMHFQTLTRLHGCTFWEAKHSHSPQPNQNFLASRSA
jgi:hypothetical protein